MSMIDKDGLVNRFAYHPPKEEHTKNLHSDVRGECFNLARYLNQVLPPGREAALAQTKIEEVMFWANAAIARNQ